VSGKSGGGQSGLMGGAAKKKNKRAELEAKAKK
jgi:hypothetical protein